eukprot:9702182-Alexandrium_andersonii.AAC.1
MLRAPLRAVPRGAGIDSRLLGRGSLVVWCLLGSDWCHDVCHVSCPCGVERWRAVRLPESRR